MCAEHKASKRFFDANFFSMTAVLVLGIAAGYAQNPLLNLAATYISEIFINLLKLVSLPIIFLSLVSTASGMDSLHEIKSLGKKVIKYTLLTTIIAAASALLIFLLVGPVQSTISLQGGPAPEASAGYIDYLLKIIPDNFVKPFVENHVISVLFMGMLLSIAILSLPDKNRTVLSMFFSSLFAAVMKITSWIIKLMPIAVWAFIVLFVRDLRAGLEVKSIALYLVCVLAANLLQALVVLPLLLKSKGISPKRLALGMSSALSTAFFTKSSSAAMPMAIRCAEEMQMSKKVVGFSFPLCTTINMNACAAFILITVLFVSMSNGITFSYLEMFVWVFIATVAAIGNAGVPMGCYFLSSAILAAMNVPLSILGFILPFYALIDMLESAINLWSDSCVTAIVNREVAGAEAPLPQAIENQGLPVCSSK